MIVGDESANMTNCAHYYKKDRGKDPLLLLSFIYSGQNYCYVLPFLHLFYPKEEERVVKRNTEAFFSKFYDKES